jgi:hypothetical protein
METQIATALAEIFLDIFSGCLSYSSAEYGRGPRARRVTVEPAKAAHDNMEGGELHNKNISDEETPVEVS